MIPTYIADTVPIKYNNYGVAPYVPYSVKVSTIGPLGINDPSKGLSYKFWSSYFNSLNNNLYTRDNELDIDTLILNEPDGIKQIQLGFDQNANDTYAYITELGELKLRFFDSLIPGDSLVSFGPAQSVTLTMDMKYYPSSDQSDILLYYIRDGAIYCRVQRDRFLIEYATPVTTGASRLLGSGMRADYRFQVTWI